MNSSVEQRIETLHRNGVVDLHYDLLMDLYEKRERANVLGTDFLPDFEAGQIGVLGAAIYLEDRYLPEMGLCVGLAQVANLYREVAQSDRFAICKSYDEIARARQSKKIALLITMEGVEPFGTDLNMMRAFFELGVRVIGLTHARRNAAGDGGVFAASGSSRDGLTAFGRDVVQQCEALGVIIDLAHLNPAGFDEVASMTKKPLIISHTNARKFYDIERNSSDAQIKLIGERGGVVGVNTILVSPRKEEATLDCYIDHIEHIAGLIGIGAVAIGFDFFEFIYQQWSELTQQVFRVRYPDFHFVPNLKNHSHAKNLTRRLMERGFTDEQIEKILFRNWMRVFEELL